VPVCVPQHTHNHSSSSGLQAKLLRFAKVSIGKEGKISRNKAFEIFGRQHIRRILNSFQTESTCVLVSVFFVRVSHTNNRAIYNLSFCFCINFTLMFQKSLFAAILYFLRLVFITSNRTFSFSRNKLYFLFPQPLAFQVFAEWNKLFEKFIQPNCLQLSGNFSQISVTPKFSTHAWTFGNSLNFF